ATQQLSELLRKGFVLDKERLKNPPIKGATALPDYFDDLLEQIRDIRASERRMYLRIRDIFALSADYEPNNIYLYPSHIYLRLVKIILVYSATSNDSLLCFDKFDYQEKQAS
ncbi:MAG: virulence RhuM family protein, partial [Akkermansia sp.]|nr:virulence RhuM family protein [Akkermansia sp.]